MAANITDYLNGLTLSPKDHVNHLDKLPDEILLMIMGQLSQGDSLDLIRLGCTCRRLRSLSKHLSLWTHIKLANGFSSWRQAVHLLVPRIHAGTQSINLGRKNRRCDRQAKKTWCPKFFRVCWGLKEFYLCNSDLSLNGLNLLPASLQVLVLDDERQEFRHEDYRQALARLKNLRDVKLIYNGQFAEYARWPERLENDLKAMLGSDAKVKVEIDKDYGDPSGPFEENLYESYGDDYDSYYDDCGYDYY